MLKYLVSVLCSFISNLCLAQEAKVVDTLEYAQLDSVVVTGQYRPQSAKNSVYQVITITKEMIQKQGAVNLQTVLNNQLNIRFSQDVATGGADITMLGLRGQNVKILMDGLPLIGRQGVSNEININQIDINRIERIEIVQGPMSVVFGADALAGVINIITKTNSSGALSVQARLHEESVGNEYGFFSTGIHNQHIGLSGKIKNWQAGVGLSHNYFGGWKDTIKGRELAWHKKDQMLANGYIGFHKNKLSIRYSLDGLDEVINNPGEFLFFQQESGDTLAQDQRYSSTRLMHQLHSMYTVNSQSNYQVQLSYSDYSRSVLSTTTSKKTGQVTLNTAPNAQSKVSFSGLSIRGVANYKINRKFHVQPGFDINLDRGNGDRLKSGSNAINDYAFFITSEITPTDKINIRPGVRVISNSVYDAPPLVPALNLKFALSKLLDIRLSYANGFRAPSLRELYFDFFDANHQIVGNPDLKAEISHSFTGSVNWKKITEKQVVYSLIFNGFYNKVKNLIDYGVSPLNNNVFTLLNVSDSRTAGTSFNGSANFRNWNLNTGVGYTGFYNDYEVQDDELPTLLWSPEINVSTGYHFVKPGLNINLFYKYTGRRPYYIQADEETILANIDPYHMADLTLNKQLFKYATLQVGIRNIFDVKNINASQETGGAHSGSAVRSIANGRSFLLGLKFQFNKY
jgi:outer membrane receptor for ferrienterochelin and colicins